MARCDQQQAATRDPEEVPPLLEMWQRCAQMFLRKALACCAQFAPRAPSRPHPGLRDRLVVAAGRSQILPGLR